MRTLPGGAVAFASVQEVFVVVGGGATVLSGAVVSTCLAIARNISSGYNVNLTFTDLLRDTGGGFIGRDGHHTIGTDFTN